MKQTGLVYLTSGSLVALLFGVIVTIIIPALEPAGPTALAQAYTEQELRGREIYKREGCWYCHTQQVREFEADRGMVHKRGDIGPESLAGDYYYQSPTFWGTERQGPDLTHVASRFGTREWHILHLRNPRALNRGTLMPSFAYLPDQELEDLTAYLLTLK
jgi:cbb3-type cytochrome c oxidase subunit II